MPLVVERSWSLQRILVSLAFASLAAGIFSVVVLYRDAALEKELVQVKLQLEQRQGLGETTPMKGGGGGGGGGGASEGGGRKERGERVDAEELERRQSAERRQREKIGAEREKELEEELERERCRREEHEAELKREREEREERDYALAEERRRRAYLEDELEAARRERIEAERVAAEAEEVGSMAAKVAGGVVLCTVLWDASFWLGNVFAVPGITDNLVCGGIASAVGVWKHNQERKHSRRDERLGLK